MGSASAVNAPAQALTAATANLAQRTPVALAFQLAGDLGHICMWPLTFSVFPADPLTCVTPFDNLAVVVLLETISIDRRCPSVCPPATAFTRCAETSRCHNVATLVPPVTLSCSTPVHFKPDLTPPGAADTLMTLRARKPLSS